MIIIYISLWNSFHMYMYTGRPSQLIKLFLEYMPSENPWSANKQFSYVRKNVHFMHIFRTLTCLQGCVSFQYKTYSLINDRVCNFSTIRSSWRSVGHWSKKKIVSDQWGTSIHTYEDVLLKIFLPKNKFQVFF